MPLSYGPMPIRLWGIPDYAHITEFSVTIEYLDIPMLIRLWHILWTRYRTHFLMQFAVKSDMFYKFSPVVPYSWRFVISIVRCRL